MSTSELVLAPFEPKGVYNTVENDPLAFLLISMAMAQLAQEPLEVCN